MSLLSGKDAGNDQSPAIAGANWDNTLAIIQRWNTEKADTCTHTSLPVCSDISSPPSLAHESDSQTAARQSDLAQPTSTELSGISQFIAKTRPKVASSAYVPPKAKAASPTAGSQDTTEKPIPKSVPNGVSQGDKVRLADITPGIYTVTYDGTSVEASVERGSSAIASLPKGTIINVLEIVPKFAADRIRARIAEPPGWISLVQPSNGASWAKKASAACLSATPESKKPDLLETASTSDSSVSAINNVTSESDSSFPLEAADQNRLTEILHAYQEQDDSPQCEVACEERPTLVRPSLASAVTAPAAETTLDMSAQSAITSAETNIDSVCPLHPVSPVVDSSGSDKKAFSKASACCIPAPPPKPDAPPGPDAPLKPAVAVVGKHFSKAASVSHVVATNACQATIHSQSGGNVCDTDSSLAGRTSTGASENGMPPHQGEKLEDAALNKTVEPHWDSWDAETLDDVQTGGSSQDVSWAIVPFADDKLADEKFKLPLGAMPTTVESVCQPEPEPLPESPCKFELFGLPRHGVAIYKGGPAEVQSFFAAIREALLPHGPGKCRFENIDISGVSLKAGAVGELLDVLSKSGATTQRLKAYRCDLGDEAVLSLVNWMTWLTCDGLPHEVHLSKNRITLVGMRRLIDCIKAKFPVTRPSMPIWLRIEENCIEKDFIESLFTDGFACRAENCTVRSCSELVKNPSFQPLLHLKHARNQKKATQVALLKSSKSEPQKQTAAPPPPPPSASSFPATCTTWPPGFGPQWPAPIPVFSMPPLPPPVSQPSSRSEPEIGADWHLPVIPRISSDGVPVAARVPIAVSLPRRPGRRRTRTRSQRKHSRRRSRRSRSRSCRSRSRRSIRRRSRSKKRDRSRSRSRRSSRRRSRSKKKDRSRSRSRKKNRSRSRSRRSSRRRSRSKDRRRSRSRSHSRSRHRSRSGSRGAARGVSHERFGSDVPTETKLAEELSSMNLKQLKAEARKNNITDEQIEACDEEDDTKAAMIKLIQNTRAPVEETSVRSDCKSEEQDVFEKKLAVAMDIRLRVNDLFKCME